MEGMIRLARKEECPEKQPNIWIVNLFAAKVNEIATRIVTVSEHVRNILEE